MILDAVPPTWLWLACGLLGALAAGAFLGWWLQRLQAQKLTRSMRALHASPDAPANPRAGLVPRAVFDKALDAAARRCRELDSTLTVLFVDIDSFAAVNEIPGHKDGDAILREIARRLHEAAPAKAAATRLGGDEFVLLCEHDLPQTQRLAQALLAAVSEPLLHGERRLHLTASIGIAAYPQHGARSRLIAQASSAMRGVKLGGGNGFAVFDPMAGLDRQEQRAMLSDLRQAVRLGQLELLYQPKIEARSLQVTAAEALLRWHHPTLGIVSPSIFIPLAERHGVIAEIGNWVIEEACRQAGAWRRSGLRMRVAINLSAYQMRQDDVVTRLQDALRANELDPKRFTVEITESLALENTHATQHTFEGLRRAGLHVAIDDFGAGQTSLAYLRQLPVSELKMDIGLVRDVASNADARVIAEAVIRMAHALQLRVVAEGVETQEQRDMLVRLGVDELQGFLFARPMSARALGLWAMDTGTQGAGFKASLFTASTVIAR